MKKKEEHSQIKIVLNWKEKIKKKKLLTDELCTFNYLFYNFMNSNYCFHFHFNTLVV